MAKSLPWFLLHEKKETRVYKHNSQQKTTSTQVKRNTETRQKTTQNSETKTKATEAPNTKPQEGPTCDCQLRRYPTKPIVL